MLDKRNLQAELTALTTRAAQLTDHMHRAAQALDTLTVTDCTNELHRIEMQIDEACFKLDCITECERVD